MHLHRNEARAEGDWPIRARANEMFVADTGEKLDVAWLIAEIARAPSAYRFDMVAIADLADQIRGKTKLNFHHVASMARRDARRPLLLAETFYGLRLIDGRHRAARSRQLGYDRCDAWIFDQAQWSALLEAQKLAALEQE